MKEPSSNPNVFEIGRRSIIHENQYKMTSNEVIFNKKTYSICIGPIDFMSQEEQNLASVGGLREIILLDRDNEKLKELCREFKKQLYDEFTDITKLTYGMVFEKAIKFSRQKITINKDFEYALQEKVEVLLGGSKVNRPVYYLHDVIENQQGVCRHHALFTAYLLGEAFKTLKLSNVSIHHCRYTINNKGAHTWVVCKRKNLTSGEYQLSIIDPTWGQIYDLSLEENYKEACRKYSTEVIDNMLLYRAKIIPSYFFKNYVSYITFDSYYNKIVLLRTFIATAQKIDYTISNTNWTLAHYAALFNDIETLQLLAAKKANFNAITTSGDTPLSFASTVESIELLVNNGANYLQPIGDTFVYKTLLKKIKDPLQLAWLKDFFYTLEKLKPNPDPSLLDICGPKEPIIDTNHEILLNMPIFDEFPSGKTPLNTPIFDDEPAEENPVTIPESLTVDEIIELPLNTQKFPEGTPQAVDKVDPPLILEEIVESPPTIQEIPEEIPQAVDVDETLPNIEEFPDSTKPLSPYILDSLKKFCEERVNALQTITRFTKGKEDKKDLYESLIIKISAARNKTSSEANTIKNIIGEVATISHHRRYRTANKAVGLVSFGFYKIEANSWTKYKEWVDNFKKTSPGIDASLIEILNDSLRIRKDKISVKKDENSKEVQGYDEYRRTPKF